VLTAVAGRLIRLFRGVMAKRSGSADELRRFDTVGSAFRYVAIVVVVLIAGTLVLDELGISVAPILATAGVAGLAIAFGAQSLLKDYFTGFFLLLEDQLRQGDIVEILGKAGEVEEVTLRYVRLRDGDGNVHFIPNGEIKQVVNRSRGFAYSMMDAAVAGHGDVEPAFAAMRSVGEAMRTDEKLGSVILADLEILGIERWELWGLSLRCRFKVVPEARDGVRREFFRRLVAEFEARQIRQP
jgi:small conductance mechanosensitive channel